jgi:transcriptional antiterminator RfaH
MLFKNVDKSWFLAQLKPNCGKIAAINLNRQGYQTFLPLKDETQHLKGKFINVTRPLFPGYIFVAIDPNQNHWHRINSTYGISRLVSFNNMPAKVPNGLVSLIISRCDNQAKLLPRKILEPGEKVILKKGPFVNFVAEVEMIGADQRVWLLIDFMGDQTRVLVSTDQI